jgi:membrane-bound ClpP family serine protease
LDPEGNVFVQGELWRAVADDGRIDEGEVVVVNRVKGLKVWVTKKPG